MGLPLRHFHNFCQSRSLGPDQFQDLGSLAFRPRACRRAGTDWFGFVGGAVSALASTVIVSRRFVPFGRTLLGFGPCLRGLLSGAAVAPVAPALGAVSRVSALVISVSFCALFAHDDGSLRCHGKARENFASASPTAAGEHRPMPISCRYSSRSRLPLCSCWTARPPSDPHWLPSRSWTKPYLRSARHAALNPRCVGGEGRF
jgi:hypothetical protein